MPARSITAELDRALTVGSSCLFLSPHLDDAVLSCGALLAALSPRTAITVATVFTGADPAPHTRAARSFLRRSRATSADSLYADRRREDEQVLHPLGVDIAHLRFPDALFRRRAGRYVPAPVARRLPELVHRYPTYRFDIARGRVSRGDRPLIQQVVDVISAVVAERKPALVFAPLAIGRHVDHLIVRDIAARHLSPIVYYSDFPYVLTAAPETDFCRTHSLRPWTWNTQGSEKLKLISGYQTQVDGLFPDGVIPLIPEIYHFADR